jgi:hypothetical protein
LHEQRLALQQRHLAALGKMAEATEELEQVERELESLDRGLTPPPQPEPQQLDEPQEGASFAGTVSLASLSIGERCKLILRDHAGSWLVPREILAEMDERGWVNAESEIVLQRLRHSLRRIAVNNTEFERDETGTVYRYRYVDRAEDEASHPPVPHTNGTGYPSAPQQLDRR